MDQIFDRLGSLLRSFTRTDESLFSDSESTSSSDPDLQEAWDELDEFLRTGENPSPQGQRAGETGSGIPDIPDALKKDYLTLGVSFGTPLPEVAKSYKLLLRKHHPDRHATNPADLAKATEKTKYLTSSFRRIRQYTETGKFS